LISVEGGAGDKDPESDSDFPSSLWGLLDELGQRRQ
jgi:hypothetical protein